LWRFSAVRTPLGPLAVASWPAECGITAGAGSLLHRGLPRVLPRGALLGAFGGLLATLGGARGGPFGDGGGDSNGKAGVIIAAAAAAALAFQQCFSNSIIISSASSSASSSGGGGAGLLPRSNPSGGLAGVVTGVAESLGLPMLTLPGGTLHRAQLLEARMP